MADINECPEACGVGLDLPQAGTFESVVVDNGTDSANLVGPAWQVTDWSPIKGWATRGRDLLVPGEDGVLQRGRMTDKMDAALRMVFTGEVDRSGASYSPLTVCAGIELNRRDFLALAVVPGPSRTLTVTWMDGVAVGPVPMSVEPLEWQDEETFGRARAVWRITLPDGPPA